MSAITVAATDASVDAVRPSPRTFPMPSSRRAWLLALLLVWVAGSAYVFTHLSGNWVASDDGMLAQSAERVLHGEMPHRDFAEVYTGGLSYLHAAGFKLFGVRLLSLRYVLFGFVVLWLPAVFYCASRFVGPLGAAAATLLSAVWTVPNYPAAMPSWYNLFFATFGAAALLHYTESRRRRWIFAAGVMGGCSIVIKIVGLYYVAACLLFLVVHAAGEADPSRRAGSTYRLAVGAALGVFVVALVWLIHNHLTVVHIYHFLLPGALLAALAGHASARAGRSGSIPALWRVAGPFLLGTAVPLAGFVFPYVLRGAAPALIRGVFVSPATRLAASASASLPPAGLLSIIPAIFLMLVVMAAVRMRSGVRGWLVGAFWVAAVAGLLAVGGLDSLDLFSWAAVAEATPLLVAAGVVVLWRNWSGNPAARGAMERCFLLLALVGLCSLNAYPFAAPIYFCYIAPLLLLALLALLRLSGGPPKPLSGVLAGFFLALALLALNAQSLRDVGIVMHPALTLVPLRLPRTGIRVRVEDAGRYESVVDTLVAHARGGVTYAGPDSPEIYFLAGLRNSTRLIFDFLEPDGRQPDSLLALVDRERITAVVIKNEPEFSRPLEARVLKGFADRFPHQWTTGGFTVRWRE